MLRGLVDVYRRDPATGNATGAAAPVAARESITVKDGVLPARPQAISAEEARRLSNEFTAPVRPVPPTATMISDEMSRVTSFVGAVTYPAPGKRSDASPLVSPEASAPTSLGGTTSTSSSTLPTLSIPGVPTASSTLSGVSSSLSSVSSSLPTVSSPVPTVSVTPTVAPTATAPAPLLSPVQKVTQPLTNLLK